MEFAKEEDKTRLWPLASVRREIRFGQILHPDVPMYNITGDSGSDQAGSPLFRV